MVIFGAEGAEVLKEMLRVEGCGRPRSVLIEGGRISDGALSCLSAGLVVCDFTTGALRDNPVAPPFPLLIPIFIIFGYN
jgi:hypothetical protein